MEVMASAKHYVVSYAKGVLAVSASVPCVQTLAQWLELNIHMHLAKSLIPRIPCSRASSHGIAVQLRT